MDKDMTVRAILFDLDGTLLDTLDDLTDSCNAALLSCGHAPRTREEVRAFVGNGAGMLIRRALGVDSGETFDRCLARFQAHYRQNLDNKTGPYPGVMELLDALRARGIRLGVVSNKFDAAVAPLCRKYFGERIDVAIGEMPGVARKPAPDGPLRALKLLNVGRDQAIYVGDSPTDVETARTSGLPCLAVSWGFRSRDQLARAGARYIIDSAGQFIKQMQIIERESQP